MILSSLLRSNRAFSFLPETQNIRKLIYRLRINIVRDGNKNVSEVYSKLQTKLSRLNIDFEASIFYRGREATSRFFAY